MPRLRHVTGRRRDAAYAHTTAGRTIDGGCPRKGKAAFTFLLVFDIIGPFHPIGEKRHAASWQERDGEEMRPRRATTAARRTPRRRVVANTPTTTIALCDRGKRRDESWTNPFIRFDATLDVARTWLERGFANIAPNEIKSICPRRNRKTKRRSKRFIISRICDNLTWHLICDRRRRIT